MTNTPPRPMIPLETNRPLWDRFFMVAPLVIIGSKEADGRYDLAPKHMATPLGWNNFYGFVCSPQHRTYHNIREHRAFTVSFPRPSQVLLASLAAAPRCEDQSKPSLLVLPTVRAHQVDGVLVEDCHIHLECTLREIIDGYGANSLITGEVVAARVADDAARRDEQDEGEQIFESPLLAYVTPGRLAEIRQTTAFPYPLDFKLGRPASRS